MKLTCDFSVTSAPHRPNGSAAPWYAPWNSPVSNSTPGLVLDFAAGAYGAGGASGTLASTVALTRSTDGTRIGPTGALEVIGPNLARVDHDPVTLARLGIVLEAARTNLFLQSATPVTQTVTVAAVPHVISFYGTGTITLSGAHTATVVGSGAYPVRTALTFTPTAGDLVLTITGIITSPQLEEGDTASSYIPTTSGPAARGEDVATVPLGSWFNPAEGTLVFSGALDGAAANDRLIEIDSGSTATRFSILWNTTLGKPQFQVWEAGALQAAVAPTGNAIGFGTPFRAAISYGANDFVISLNGSDVVADTSGILPTGLTTLRLGRSIWGAQGLMLGESVVYYPARLSDPEVKALSA